MVTSFINKVILNIFFNLRAVLLSIQALLSSPNPDDPLNNDAAN
jgi:ubiquitin-protein ligase